MLENTHKNANEAELTEKELGVMETVSGPIREEMQYKYTRTYIHEHWSTGPDTS